jgi:peptide/nickel transport system substrate-binding protein
MIHATLVRLDRTTGKVGPRLAREWTSSPDGLTWVFKLQEGVTFSDGAPFTSADVVFSFQALYDPKVESEIGASLLIDGKPMQVRALDAHTVSIVFPSAYAPGIALLDAVPILPEHKLRAAFDAGTFRNAWSVTTPLADIVGLGPFVIEEYIAGQSLVFARNPKFWLRDAEGRTLPYVDRVELEFVADQNAETLRLQTGETDLSTDRVRFEDLASLQDLARRGQITLHDAGVSISPDMLWFNLEPGASPDRPWLQREELRHAIAHAVNRTTIANTVFLGEAEEIAGPITTGHGEWFLPDLRPAAYDPAQATSLLASIGLTDRNGDGLLDDAQGHTASFSILTQKGNSVRERSAAIIQEQLRKVGLKVDIVPLEFGSMRQQWQAKHYDAIFFAIEFDAFDPARNLDFWLSSKPFHFWRPNQKTPATPWEARIDELMTRQAATIDPAQRHQLFADAQRVLAEHAPVLYFVAPHVMIATSARVGGVTASVLNPSVLWNAERLFLTTPTSSAGR